MLRCSRCDAVSVKGNYSNTPFKSSRTFYPSSSKPWLDICSDCSPFVLDQVQEKPEESWADPEVPNIDEDWDR